MLAFPEIRQFIADLDELYWSGRPGFGSAVLVGAMVVKSVYALPTFSRTARLIAEHDALRDAIGGAPSQWACYRFAAKLREHGDALATCIDVVGRNSATPSLRWARRSRLMALICPPTATE